MKSLMPQIDSNDGLFHNGNPATGEQGTRVTDTWLNNLQDRVRDVQAEAHYVLQKAGFQPVENKQTQLYEAIVKIIDDNRKKASTTQKGEVQLYSGYDSDSEEMAATPKVIKILKGFIDSVMRSLTNYIPNSKKSNEVNSSSSDTVATSAAVKTAYDKGVAANNNAEGRISKSGDRLTGILYSVGISSKHFGYGAYANQYTSGAPFMVETTGSQDRDTYHPFVKGLVRSKGRYGAGFSFGYTTKQGAGDGFGRGIIHLVEDNGSNKTWAFEHNGDFNSAGDVRTSNGKSLNTAAQLSDFQYQKIGDFEIRRYPDGMMIQTYFTEFNDIHASSLGFGGTGQKQLTWAVSFVGKPMVFGNITTSLNDHHDVGVNILTKSTNTTLYWYNYEHSNPNQGLCRLQFLAVGRWK
jgi:probable tail fiber protein|nr:MAG TPA: tail fiber repeat protein [Caudoviricetes sp.]